MEPVIRIRNEQTADRARVETLTREAFYNLYVPGCVEHYLVHIMREHADFIPELDFVVERDGEVIGNIMYTRARLVDEAGGEKPVLTFGPVCIAPAYQRQGYGRQLIEHSFARAVELGYDTDVIFGSPANYVGRGFQSCRRFGVRAANGTYPAAMLVKELIPHRLDGRQWTYFESPVMEIDEQAARRYDDALPPMERKRLPSQEEFYILSHATLA